MKKNVGKNDRLIRLLIAGVLIALIFTEKVTGTISYVMLVLAVVFTITAFVETCPIWAALKINTRGKEKDE